ncbi:MAG TPA: M20/M25/M40 family metallo-hydrolase [Gaiellaceae bacterium]|nr:M20/M25/M40 family metallo-hydrolase [Gaiellaceae bacterium]
MTSAEAGRETVELLQRLIRVDTTNPPGNETAAAELLRAYLESAGVECALYARVPERANLVARIRGRGDGPSLALLSHTDVVLADPAEWTHDPFAGELVEGEVWGRGALDMKGEVAASAVALATLAREGWRGSGDLIFVAAADEEVGDGFGLEWLVEEHPDAVRSDFSVNEGAGDRVELGGGVYYVCATAEKMSSPFVLRVHGRSGHASMPSIADNALVKAVPFVERLGAFAAEPRVIPEVSAFFETVLGEVPDAADALAVARGISPLAAELVEPLLAMTVSPTKAHASDKRNVIPAVCEITVDVRLLPDQTPAEAEAALRECLGPGAYELELIEGRGGTRSPIGGRLWDAIEEFVAAEEPGARPVPACVAGFTDSHWVRDAFGTVAYGFFPARLDPQLAARLIHSADERVPVSDLELGVRFLRHVATTVCA